MPAPAAKAPPLALVCGDDEFAVKKRAREIYQQWCDELGGMDHEIIEATVSNSGDALKTIAKLREALQTLPFFGSAARLSGCATAIFSATNAPRPRRPSPKRWRNWRRN